ncbi:hypothetical protein GLAREA_03606 [Glarea lozoyensis ATCC 20868]|uniref:Uncharacterized protein n=1 Tax=Glarea lozoyensis (strain ATCC 20868 / MF5171) TaxID=1116229 RepID=S3D0E3_GLAL2|nr:uncharacterized protein GLAREA_03606 [Glarea lozoyensis ATCC 20868]EPE30639.1 hypothetical protein GLAREA_03606 [Glarea lozoyensis ATCC 20868]
MGDLSKYDSMYMNLRFDIIIARGSKEMRFNLYTALADSQFENIAIVYPGHMFSGKQNIDKMFNSLKRIVVLGEADSKITRIPGVDLEGLLANKSVVSTEQLTYDKVRWLVSTYKKFELLRQAMDIDGDIVSYERGTRVLHLEFKQKT